MRWGAVRERLGDVFEEVTSGNEEGRLHLDIKLGSGPQQLCYLGRVILLGSH